MPLGLLSIASSLLQITPHVKVYKPKSHFLKNTDSSDVATDVLKHKPDVIGFSTWCISYPTSLLIAKEIKRVAPEVSIIFGGPQASILATKTLCNFPYVDYILSGEADFTFVKLIKNLTQSKRGLTRIPGLSYRTNGGKVLNNRLNEGVTILDELPIPAYHLVPELKWIKLDVGRGCPFQCTYCSTNNFFAQKHRVKSANRIVEEMLLAYSKRKIKSFSFAHDMFTMRKGFVFELCDKLISIKHKQGIEFSWNCSARIDCVTKEMLLKMKEAGCRNIFFGIETGSKRMQKIINKNLDVPQAYEIAEICRVNGINMHASFIIGFPEETEKELNQTLQCALTLALKGALTQVSELSLLPGTPLFEQYHKKLQFDGRFSNFSRNLCGKKELQLIKNYPDIFSSFYYLPVDTLDRFEMLYLRLIFNKAKQFRNTLFMLSDHIGNKLLKAHLLQLFKNELQKIKKAKQDLNNIPLFWIRVIDNFMIKNEIRKKVSYISDVFAFESYSALLQLIFYGWHRINDNNKTAHTKNDFCIKPTPIWKIVTTSYKLEKIIASENNWIVNPSKCRKGMYSYLVIAVSEVKCKRLRITSKEIFLLEQLTELFYTEYVKKVESVLSEKETLLWIKKLRMLGVVEISSAT